MKLGHLGVGGLTLAGVIAVGAAIDASPAHAQAKNCPAAVGAVMKTLRISTKAVLPRDIKLACIRTGNKPALASRNLLGHFVGKMKIKPGPLAIGNCSDALLYTSTTAGMPPAFANLKDIATACKLAKERPALASRNFSHRFVVNNKLEGAKAAPADLAKTCTGRITAISKALKLNPKFANAKDIATACKLGKGRPVLTMRNYLDRFVVSAKIAPSVRKPGQAGRAGQAAGLPGGLDQRLENVGAVCEVRQQEGHRHRLPARQGAPGAGHVELPEPLRHDLQDHPRQAEASDRRRRQDLRRPPDPGDQAASDQPEVRQRQGHRDVLPPRQGQAGAGVAELHGPLRQGRRDQIVRGRKL